MDVLGLCSIPLVQVGPRRSRRHTDGNTLGMNGAQVSVLKERHKISLNGLLKSTDGRRLEAEIGFEILCDFTDQALEWKFTDQKLGRFLVTTDLTQSNGT